MKNVREERPKNDFILRFLSPAPIMVVTVNVNPDKNIEKTHQ